MRSEVRRRKRPACRTFVRRVGATDLDATFAHVPTADSVLSPFPPAEQAGAMLVNGPRHGISCKKSRPDTIVPGQPKSRRG